MISNNACWQIQRHVGELRKCRGSCSFDENFMVLIYTRGQILRKNITQERRLLITSIEMTAWQFSNTNWQSDEHCTVPARRPGEPTSEVPSAASFAPTFVSIEYSPRCRKPILNFPITAPHHVSEFLDRLINRLTTG